MLRKKVIIIAILLVPAILYGSYHYLIVKHYPAYLSFRFGQEVIYITDIYLQNRTLLSYIKSPHDLKNNKVLGLHGLVINSPLDEPVNIPSDQGFNISVTDRYSNAFHAVEIRQVSQDQRSNIKSFDLSVIIPGEELLIIAIGDERTGDYKKTSLTPSWELSSLKKSGQSQPQRFIQDFAQHINKKNPPTNKYILENNASSLREILAHDYWHTSDWDTYITYQEQYGDSKDVFAAHITFYTDDKPTDILAQQTIYLVVFRNDWLIIDANPVSII